MNLKEVHIKEDRAIKRKQKKLKYTNKTKDKLKRKMNFGVKEVKRQNSKKWNDYA
jgi:hypothetical protein